MSSPYVLSQIPRADLDKRKVHSNCTLRNGKPSRRELVTAIDSHGLNIYNLRSTHLEASYSLPLSTRFTCAPISVVDTSTRSRKTYAVYESGCEIHNFTLWADRKESSTLETSQATMILPAPAFGIYFTGASVMVILENDSPIDFKIIDFGLAKYSKNSVDQKTLEESSPGTRKCNGGASSKS